MTYLNSYIDDLDRLFHPIDENGQVLRSEYGIRTPASKTGQGGKITVSLAGPAGTGKSILALHYAAGFLEAHRQDQDRVLVLYVSTDLSHEVACTQFQAFGLDQPSNLIPGYVARNSARRVVAGETGSPPRFSGAKQPIELKKRTCEDLGSGRLLNELLTKAKYFDKKLEVIQAELLKDIGQQPEAESAETAEQQSDNRWLYFIDLQRKASGDDWNYLDRFFKEALPLLESEAVGYKHILIVIDAIEGLDTPDAGELPISRHGRRQRLASLLESTAPYANLVFSLEVTEPDKATDEEFVADIAIHLRSEGTEDNPRITLEVVKARGMYSYKGRQELQIRPGHGTTTDAQPNQDDLRQITPNSAVHGPSSSRNVAILVPSLSVIEQRIEAAKQPERPDAPFEMPESLSEPRNLNFGIPQLDNMLAKNGGLPSRKIHTIFGEVNTHRSRLVIAFLAQACYHVFQLCFIPELKLEARKQRKLRGEPALSPTKEIVEAIESINGFLFGANDEIYHAPAENDGVAVLFGSGRRIQVIDYLNVLMDNWAEVVKKGKARSTTNADTIEYSELLPAAHLLCKKEGNKFLEVEGKEQFSKRPRRFYYRRLPNRSSSKEAVYRILSENIKSAIVQQIIVDTRRHNINLRRNKLSSCKVEDVNEYIDRFCEEFPNILYPGSWRVRIAFEDISSTFSAINDLNDRNATIAAIIELCRLSGVTTLFVDTVSGGPLQLSLNESSQILRSRTDTAIYSWHVPYGSGTKVAITAMPPINRDQQVIVRELRELPDSNALMVDRCLELYDDVLPGQSKLNQDLSRVPLTLMIASEGPLWHDDAFERNCRALLTSCLGGSNEVTSKGKADIISVVPMARRDLEAYVNYSFHASEPRTVVVMVDEYWSRETKSRIIREQLTGKDRFLELNKEMIDTLRNDLFDNEVQPFPDPSDPNHSRLVPFTWNFGLTLLRQRPWRAVSRQHFNNELMVSKSRPLRRKINAIRAVQREITRKLDSVRVLSTPDKSSSGNLHPVASNDCVFWHDFFASCEHTSQHYSPENPLMPFEIDMPDVQSLLCFILEVWFSTFVWLNTANEHDSKGKVDAAKVRDCCWKCMRHFREPKVDENGNVTEEGGLSIVSTITDGLAYIADVTKKNPGNVSWTARSQESARLVLCLYLTLEMLSQIVDFSEWPCDPESYMFLPRVSTGNAIAGRYWYTTASSMLRSTEPNGEPLFDANDPFIPLALPGHFSNRGDWHLAVLASSRSRYLGELAIGELSRTRAAIVRTQVGVGLPLLKFKDGNVRRQIRTALPSPYGGRNSAFDYEYIRAISPLRSKLDMSNIGGNQAVAASGHQPYSPIYRSEIRNYLQENMLVAKELCRLLIIFSQRRKEYSMTWINYYDLVLRVEGSAKKHDLDLAKILTDTSGNKVAIKSLLSWKLFKEILSALDGLMNVGGE